MTTRAKETPHGTLSCGKYRKCKRPECVEAARAYRLRVYRLKGYGQWQPLVDAEPARQHLQKLNAMGCSYASIATALGKHKAAITNIAYEGARKTRRIRRELNDAILEITIDSIHPPRVDSTGTSRRIRALNAIGWPNTIIGEHIGSWNTQVNHIHHQRKVLRETAMAVADCYERLRNLDPIEQGVPAPVARSIMARAAKHGARDPLWWEDWDRIDDPDFDPATAERELPRNGLGALRRGEIQHLMSYGCEAEEIAHRLDMATTTVRTVMNEIASGQRRDRTGAAA